MELSLALEAGDLHFRNLSPLPPSLFWVAHLAWSVSQRSRQAVSRLNYWSFAQHALGESLGRRTNICGVVVMWGLNTKMGLGCCFPGRRKQSLKRDNFRLGRLKAGEAYYLPACTMELSP